VEKQKERQVRKIQVGADLVSARNKLYFVGAQFIEPVIVFPLPWRERVRGRGKW